MNGFNTSTRGVNGFSGLNNGYGNNFPSNIMNGMSGINTYPRYEIIQVNGRNGAEMFQMGPNSKILLLDSSDPIVWLVQTDGAGYKTVDPYSITPYQPAPQIDINSLNDRLTALEEKVNAKSYFGTSKQSRKQQSHGEQQQQSNGYVETTNTTN